MNKTWMLLLLPLLFTSCATKYVWDRTYSYVVIAQSEAIETDLNARRINYIRSNVSPVLFVEKSGIEKCKNYVIRTIAAPFTVVVDTSTAVLVVGGAAFVMFKSQDYGGESLPYIGHLLDAITDKIENMRAQLPNNVPEDTARKLADPQH
jgi:hypothetical protein